MRYLIAFVTIVSVVTVGCNGRQQSRSVRQLQVAPQANQQQPRQEETPIPSDVSFSIIESSTIPGVKRSLDVRLNKKVSEQTLRAIALKLKAQDSRTYKRTFIGYYLPGMAVGAGAWATTHFDPSLEVRILGLSAEDESKLVAESDSSNRDIIGSWLDESPFIGGRITIFNESGQLYMEHKFKDGSSLKEKLVEGKSPLGRRFDMVEGNSAGDHWVLDPAGNLQIRDDEGLIGTAKRIK